MKNKNIKLAKDHASCSCSSGHCHEHGVETVESSTSHGEHKKAEKDCCGHDHDHGDDDHSHGGCGCAHEHKDRFDKSIIIKIVLSVIFAAVGIILENLEIAIIPLISFIIAYLIIGGDVLLTCVKNIRKKVFFDENTLMSIATIGAFAIGEFPEAVGVMLFYQIGELIQQISVRRSKKSITNLMDIRPDYANLKRGDEVVRVSPKEINIGDTIIVKSGEKIPLDGVVIDGESFVDTSALTGESVARKLSRGDSALGGCINGNGLLTIEVSSTFENSTVSKILAIIEGAPDKKAESERFITKFAKYYTPVVVFLAVVVAVIPSLITGDWNRWIYTALLFLVTSCPCALLLSVPLTFFCGLGVASKKGVLVKGSSYLEAAANLETIAFDKTGTVTEGIFRITEIQPVNITKEELLELGAAAEHFSNHPIAQVLKSAYENEINPDNLGQVTEIAGKGVKVLYKGKTLLAGNEKLMNDEKIDYKACENIGTIVYISYHGQYVGNLVISDTVKENALSDIKRLKKVGINRLAMLTGDNEEISQGIAEKLGIDEVYSSLLPQDKVKIMDRLTKESDNKAAFVGDGINDAPVLALSPIGISVGGLGSDAAVEASDVVLMKGDLGGIANLISVAKKTLRVVGINIAFILAIKIAVMILGILNLCPMWAAVFADVGTCLLSVLISVASLRVK